MRGQFCKTTVWRSCLYASDAYSGVSNCRHVTAIYFGKICTPLRSYWIPLRLLNFRFFQDFLIFLRCFVIKYYSIFETKRDKTRYCVHRLFVAINFLVLCTMYIYYEEKFVCRYAYCIPLRQLILAYFVSRYAYSIMTAIRFSRVSL